MAKTDTAGGISAVAKGIGGFTGGYMGGRRMKMQEAESAARTRRADQEYGIRKQRLDFETEKAGRANRMSSTGDAFQALSMGDKPYALQLANQYRAPGEKIVDMNIDPNTGNWNRMLENNQTETIPFQQIAPLIPAFNQLMRSRYSTSSKKEPFYEEQGIEELNTYFNVAPKNTDNPMGITSAKRRGVLDALKRGMTYKQIGQSLGLKRRGAGSAGMLSDVERFEKGVQAAKRELKTVTTKATSGVYKMKNISAKEQEKIDAATRKLRRVENQLSVAKEMGAEDLGQMRYGGAPAQQGVTMAPATLPGITSRPTAAPAPVVAPAPVPIAGAPEAPAASMGIQELDSNKDGALDERDEMVKMALWAEANPDQIKDPRDLEEAKAILKVYRGQLQKQTQKTMLSQGAIRQEK